VRISATSTTPRSTDNGSTWSAPLKLNTDATTRSQWMPNLAVTPRGEVFVARYDARSTTGTNYQRWGRRSLDNGATWQADEQMSDATSPLPIQPDPSIQACYAGDYERSHGGGFFH
jgi:Neuraminidase (sialidase)